MLPGLPIIQTPSAAYDVSAAGDALPTSPAAETADMHGQSRESRPESENHHNEFSKNLFETSVWSLMKATVTPIEVACWPVPALQCLFAQVPDSW